MTLFQMKQTLKQIERHIMNIAKTKNVIDLKGPQGRVISYLKKQEQPVYLKDIEKLLDIQKSVASKLVSRMVKNGYVTEKEGEHDKRYKEIVLTPHGHEKVNDIITFMTEVDTICTKNLSQQQLQQLFDTLQQIENNLALADEQLTREEKIII